MPTLKIDNQEITAAPGTTILQAALANGIEIPHYCYHPALTIVGSCRMCLVEVDNNPKLVLSCATEVKEGMEVRTQTEQVRDARRSMLEFFLINHPLDCPICDKAGECLLQDYTYQYGSSHSRMVEEKRVRPTKDLGGNILLYRNRCVLCTRCVRFFEDVVGEPHLIVENRGYHSDISIFPGKGLTHKMSGNVVEICPVGCLIDKDFLFHARVWNLIRTRSVCAGCSAGCNIHLEHKDNQIFRIRSRVNPQVNQEWICDDGRYLYRTLQQLERLTAPQDKQGAVLAQDEAVGRIAAQLTRLKEQQRLHEAAIAGCAHASIEENFMLRRVLAEAWGIDQVFLHARRPEGEDITYKSGFTIHSDKTPNRRGAGVVLESQTDLWAALRQGKIKSLFVLNSDWRCALNDEEKRLLADLEFLAVWDVTRSDFVRTADVALPMPLFSEQDGTFISAGRQLQRFHAALQPPRGVQPAWRTLLAVAGALGITINATSAAEVLNELASRVPAFQGVSCFKLGDMGIQLREG